MLSRAAMGFTERFLKSLTKIFLGLHWIAAFYAVIESMLPIFDLPIYYVAGFLFIPLFFAPVGPLSLTLFDLLGLMIIPFYFLATLRARLLIALGVAAGIVILKFFAYSAVRKNKVLGVSATWILTAYTVIILLTMTSVLLAFLSYFPSPETMPVIALVFTVPMDLVVFSYVKFRDAVRGVESEKWIPALATLWTAIPSFTFVTIIELHWLPETFWRSTSAFILTFMRIAIAAVQSLYVALYAALYIRSGGVALEAERSVYAAQTTTVPGGQHG